MTARSFQSNSLVRTAARVERISRPQLAVRSQASNTVFGNHPYHYLRSRKSSKAGRRHIRTAASQQDAERGKGHDRQRGYSRRGADGPNGIRYGTKELPRANLSTSTFFLPKTKNAVECIPLSEDLHRVHDNLPARLGLHDAVSQAAERHLFFHWYLAFPEIMKRCGFDVVLGNPPWERVMLQEQESHRRNR